MRRNRYLVEFLTSDGNIQSVTETAKDCYDALALVSQSVGRILDIDALDVTVEFQEVV